MSAKKARKPRTRKPPQMDIRTVALRAKVSIATVSRTINRIPTVDPVLARRVWKAIEELDYFPNTQARALVSGKSHLLGLIESGVLSHCFASTQTLGPARVVETCACVETGEASLGLARRHP